MSRIVTVPKIKSNEEPYGTTADTISKDWRKIDETDTTMTIEILE